MREESLCTSSLPNFVITQRIIGMPPLRSSDRQGKISYGGKCAPGSSAVTDILCGRPTIPFVSEQFLPPHGLAGTPITLTKQVV
jgi:hypothetical protein